MPGCACAEDVRRVFWQWPALVFWLSPDRIDHGYQRPAWRFGHSGRSDGRRWRRQTSGCPDVDPLSIERRKNEARSSQVARHAGRREVHQAVVRAVAHRDNMVHAIGRVAAVAAAVAIALHSS